MSRRFWLSGFAIGQGVKRFDSSFVWKRAADAVGKKIHDSPSSTKKGDHLFFETFVSLVLVEMCPLLSQRLLRTMPNVGCRGVE